MTTIVYLCEINALSPKVPPSDEEAKFQSFLSGNTRTYTNDVKRKSILDM